MMLIFLLVLIWSTKHARGLSVSLSKPLSEDPCQKTCKVAWTQQVNRKIEDLRFVTQGVMN
jgi:hypothetical protein